MTTAVKSAIFAFKTRFIYDYGKYSHSNLGLQILKFAVFIKLISRVLNK